MSDNHELLITPEMVEAAWQRQYEALDHEARIALWLAADVPMVHHVGKQERLMVIDLDGPLHTPEQPICSNDKCICADAEFAAMAKSAPAPKHRRRILINTTSEDYGSKGVLNGNDGFRLMR